MSACAPLQAAVDLAGGRAGVGRDVRARVGIRRVGHGRRRHQHVFLSPPLLLLLLPTMQGKGGYGMDWG
jgi:hypothetical protein